MPTAGLNLCDVLEGEFVNISREADPSENEAEYEAQLAAALPEEFRNAYLEIRRQAKDAQATAAGEQLDQDRLALLMRILRREERAALCLSGGGIRSATFGLGVLQGLAHRRVVERFHYLSTVSGGGYIGSWLSAWMAPREPAQPATTIQEIEASLAAAPQGKVNGELHETEYLRSYSNYLSPRVGLLSVDTWTLASTIFRNMLLNWMILVPMLAACLLIPRLSLAIVRATDWSTDAVLQTLLWSGFGLAVIGVIAVGACLPSIGGRKCSQNRYLAAVLTPLVLSAILLTTYWAWAYRSGQLPSLWAFAVFGAALHFAGWLSASGLLPGIKKTVGQPGGGFAALLRLLAANWIIVFAVVTGALGGMLAHALSDVIDPLHHPGLATCLAFPAVFAIYYLATVLFIGLASKQTNDEDREWWARSGAWLMIVMAAWLAASFLVIFGPFVFHKIGTAIVGAGGMAAGLLGSLAGASPKTGSGQGGEGQQGATNTISNIALKLAPIAFLVCLLVMIAKGSELTLDIGVAALIRSFPTWLSWLGPEVYSVLALIVLLALIATLMSRFVNVNVFSLHAMYRNRLIRAYLGASNPNRDPDKFTGFDPKDNLHMHNLSPRRPFHVINITLNLVKGARLAWQQRKAESFTVTRLHSGSLQVAYQPSRTYGGRDGLTLGTAMAISGAAASPNMGYHSSPLLTFLMTFFNARLGWWLANPGSHGAGLWNQAGPKSALQSLVGEALGWTDDTNQYVYLSDGGHFENLGLYEMVLRRCHTIVAIDASADPKYQFDDLANAIRKIRVDLGIPIRFNKQLKFKTQSTPPTVAESVHCATAEICYTCVDGEGVNGTLVYLKPVLDHWQSLDVDQYKTANQDFPQQPTSDQFFDEAQFESYRRLGMETIQRICQATPAAGQLTLAQFVTAAERHSNPDPQVFVAAC